MTSVVQHLVVDPSHFAAWSATVARNDRFVPPSIAMSGVPPIRHVVFIVVENKHFDEEFGDEPRANADPSLLVYGRKYTPNLHALAERYALFNDFMGNGDASIYGHAWMRRPPVSRTAFPFRSGRRPVRIHLCGRERVFTAFGARRTAGRSAHEHERCLRAARRVDRRTGSSQRVVSRLRRTDDHALRWPHRPGLAGHADRAYPGAHIDFGILDTERAKMFESDLDAHGLAIYTYLTLPDDHTAGSRAGFYTPESFIANNDAAFGSIVAALSKRPEWQSTNRFCRSRRRTRGDHVNAKRMPVVAIGPYVKRGAVDGALLLLPVDSAHRRSALRSAASDDRRCDEPADARCVRHHVRCASVRFPSRNDRADEKSGQSRVSTIRHRRPR